MSLSSRIDVFGDAQKQSKATFKVSERTDPPPSGVRTLTDSEGELVRMYSKRSGQTKVVYKVGGTDSQGYGRIYPQKVKWVQTKDDTMAAATASTVPKWLRSLCYADKNWYVDVSNCLPTIEFQLGQAFNLSYPEDMLSMRDRVRDALIAEGVDADDARRLGKGVVLRVMYGASLSDKGSIAKAMKDGKHHLDKIKGVLAEMIRTLNSARDGLLQRMDQAFMAAVSKNAQPKGSPEHVRKKVKNRCISLALQSVERVLICERLAAILRSEGREVTGFVHDGLLFARNDGESSFPVDLIARAQAKLSDETGFDLTLAQEELVVPHTERWRTDLSLSPPSTPSLPAASTAVKDTPIPYPMDVLNHVALAGELGSDGQEVQAFVDRITHKLKRGHEEFDDDCENVNQWLELRGDGSRHVMCESCNAGSCSLHPRPAKRSRVEDSVVPWLQTFLKANQAIIGKNITFNIINVNSDTEAACKLDPAHREFFEDNFAFIQEENKFYEFSTGLKYKKHDFIEGYHKKQSVDAKGKKHSSASLWAHDENKKTFKKLVYQPGKPVIMPNPEPLSEPFYNTWRSAGASLDPRGCCDLFYDLLLHICDDDTGIRDYILDLFAWKVQNVAKQPGVCLQLISKEQGTGKSFVFCCLGKALFGHRGETPHGSFNILDGMKADEVWGKFNGHMTNMDVILIEELDNLKKNSNKRVYDKLKQCITGEYTNKRDMYSGYESIRNFSLWLLTSNNGYAVRPDPGDRRHVIVHASDWLLRQGDDKGKSFIARVASQLETEGGYGRLHHDLKHRSLDRANGGTFRPDDFTQLPTALVEWRNEAMEANTTPEQRMLDSFFSSLVARSWSEEETRQCLKAKETSTNGYCFDLEKTKKKGVLYRTPHSVLKEIQHKFPHIEEPSVQNVRIALVKHGFMPGLQKAGGKVQRVYFGFKEWSEDYGP